MIIQTTSPEQTRDVGRLLGELVRPGDVVVLDGDLGAGKTTFTQGLGAAIGLTEPVTSPTFVLAREQAGKNGKLTHVDAYRLGSLAEWDDLDVDLEGGITVIEWGERIADSLPFDRLTIRFAADDDQRRLELSTGGSRSHHLLDGLIAELEKGEVS